VVVGVPIEASWWPAINANIIKRTNQRFAELKNQASRWKLVPDRAGKATRLLFQETLYPILSTFNPLGRGCTEQRQEDW